jgi:hypothetical protein
MNLTGNVIKVNADLRGKNLVYTQQEVDAKLLEFEKSIEDHLAGKYSNYTLANVLNMLQNNCIITNPAGDYNGGLTTGTTVCQKYNADYEKSSTCIFAETVKGTTSMTEVIPCNLNINTSVWGHVMCCSI